MICLAGALAVVSTKPQQHSGGFCARISCGLVSAGCLTYQDLAWRAVHKHPSPIGEPPRKSVLNQEDGVTKTRNENRLTIRWSGARAAKPRMKCQPDTRARSAHSLGLRKPRLSKRSSNMKRAIVYAAGSVDIVNGAPHEPDPLLPERDPLPPRPDPIPLPPRPTPDPIPVPTPEPRPRPGPKPPEPLP